MKKVALHIFDKIFILKWYVVNKSTPYFLSKRKSVVFILKQFCFQLLSCVWLFVTSRTAACQASLSFTISRILLEFISIELVMLSNHLILCHLLLLPSMFPSIRFFFTSQLFTSGSIGASASASVLLMNVQNWFSLGLTVLISMQFGGLSRGFSFITIQIRKVQFLQCFCSITCILKLEFLKDVSNSCFYFS